jgi:predicted RNA-binding protein YlxR (DUF448 family)
VACRTVRPKRELVRIVRTPGGELMIDETGRVAGRGAYLCRDAACWTTALGRGALGRALEAPLPVELRETLRAGAAKMMTTDEGGAGGTK